MSGSGWIHLKASNLVQPNQHVQSPTKHGSCRSQPNHKFFMWRIRTIMIEVPAHLPIIRSGLSSGVGAVGESLSKLFPCAHTQSGPTTHVRVRSQSPWTGPTWGLATIRAKGWGLATSMEPRQHHSGSHGFRIIC